MNCRKTTFIWLQLFPGCPSTVAVKRSTDGEKKCEQRRGVARRLSCRSQTFLFLWSCACGQLSSNVHRDDQAHDGEEKREKMSASAQDIFFLLFFLPVFSYSGLGCSLWRHSSQGTQPPASLANSLRLLNAFGVVLNRESGKKRKRKYILAEPIFFSLFSLSDDSQRLLASDKRENYFLARLFLFSLSKKKKKGRARNYFPERRRDERK